MFAPCIGARNNEFKITHDFVERVLADDMHAKRVYSLANATLGVMTSASLAVNTIGHGLALARGRLDKHAIKQVDRLLSNQGIDMVSAFRGWVPNCIGSRDNIEVAMDWTDFDADDQATLMLSLVTRHGSATPLVWRTVEKATLKDNRNHYEDELLRLFKSVLSAHVKVLMIADRGFGDHKLYRFLTEDLRFDYLIRFRGNIKVTAVDGETPTAAEWIGQGGRLRIMRGAAVTAQNHVVGAVVCVHAKDMKDPWCLATSRGDEKAKTILKKYAKRWGIECTFRNNKDPRFGMGMDQIRISSPQRRDRLWLISALAAALLTLLGAAGEALGFDKHLKANTSKRRVHSLFRQGCLLYDHIPAMLEARLQPLMEKFAQLILDLPLCADVYGTI